MFSPSFGRPQPDWPLHTTVCGFPFYDEEFAEYPSELDDFINEGDPPIAFTLGSSAVQVAGHFFEEAITAAGLAGGFAYWLIAGWSAGFWKPVFRRTDAVLLPETPKPH